MTEPSLTVECLPTLTSLPVGAESALDVLVRLRVPTPSHRRPRPSLTAVLAVDVSVSMSGQPLDQVIRSIECLLDRLDDGDRLALVAFAAEATVVAALQTLTVSGRRNLRQAVRGLRNAPGTNLGEGLRQAAALLPPRRGDESRMVLVLSDGQPSVGLASPDELGARATALRAQGVTVSTLGYGEHHDAHLMRQVATAGGGQYAFVPDPLLAEGHFNQAIGAQLDVAIERPRLVLTPSEDADIVRVLGDWSTHVGADGLRVTLPDLRAGETLELIVETRLRAWREGDWRLMYATVSGAETGSSAEVTRQGVATVVVTASGPAAHGLESVAAAAVARADEVRAQARALADRGDFAGAIERLHRALVALRATVGFCRGRGDRLDDAHEALRDDVVFYEQRPSRRRTTRHNLAQQGYLALARVSSSSLSPHAFQMESQRVVSLSACLQVLEGSRTGETIALTGARTFLGRGADCDVVLDDQDVSRRHALIEQVGDAFWVLDLGSSGAVFVNGSATERRQLGAGDVVRLGSSLLRFWRD